MPVTRSAPSTAAVTASTPLPLPTSSTEPPGGSAARSARRHRTVVGWSPRPNVAPGSMRTTVVPGGSSNGSHAGTTTRSFSIHEAWAWARHVSVTDGSSSMTFHRQRAGNPSAARATAGASSPSEVHSSTRSSSVPLVPPRSSMAATPSAHSASDASSASLAGTVSTSPSTAECLADPAQALPVLASLGDVDLPAVLDLLGPGPSGLDGGRRADGERAGRDVGAVEQDGVGGDDRAAVDDDPVEDDRARRRSARRPRWCSPRGGRGARPCTRRRRRSGARASCAGPRRPAPRSGRRSRCGRRRRPAAPRWARSRSTGRCGRRRSPRRRGARRRRDGSAACRRRARRWAPATVAGRASRRSGCGARDRKPSRTPNARPVGSVPMPSRIEVELTSARPDGNWTWRAAGAREPRGVVERRCCPTGPRSATC